MKLDLPMSVAKEIARAFKRGGINAAVDEWNLIAVDVYNAQGDTLMFLSREDWVEILHDAGIGYIAADRIVPWPRRRSTERDQVINREAQAVFAGLSYEAKLMAVRGIVNGRIDYTNAKFAALMPPKHHWAALQGIVWC